MEPHLQFLSVRWLVPCSDVHTRRCGPLLKYDTVINDIWHGAIMIVTADSGSIYSPHPCVSLEWDPAGPERFRTTSSSSAYNSPNLPPANQPGRPDDDSQHSQATTQPNDWIPSPLAGFSVVHGQELWVYSGPYGSCTFWRMMIQIPLADNEMSVTYRVNNGHGLQFFIPGKGQEMRWATYSVSNSALIFLT
jgi:hypothetical protein